MQGRACAAKASLSSTRSRSPAASRSRASSLRVAGMGPVPISDGSTPATAAPTKRASGAPGAGRRRSSPSREASSSAAAPSLMPEALPAVTVPPALRNTGRSAASSSGVVCGPRVLVDLDPAWAAPLRAGTSTGTSSRAKRPAAWAAAQCRWLRRAKASWAARRHLVPLGHLLGGLAQRVGAVQRLHARVDEAPAQRRVVHGDVAAREGLARLGHHQRRARHRLDPARDHQVGLAGGDGARAVDHRLQPRAAQPVDRGARAP